MGLVHSEGCTSVSSNLLTPGGASPTLVLTLLKCHPLITHDQASRPDGDLSAMGLFALVLLGAAFMPPLPRTIAFVLMGASLFLYYYFIVNLNFCAQVTM